MKKITVGYVLTNEARQYAMTIKSSMESLIRRLDEKGGATVISSLGELPRHRGQPRCSVRPHGCTSATPKRSTVIRAAYKLASRAVQIARDLRVLVTPIAPQIRAQTPLFGNPDDRDYDVEEPLRSTLNLARSRTR